MSLLPLAAALLATGPGVTPEGPATLRATVVAPIPYARFGPRVVVRWRVEVSEGGAGGPVALRVMRGNPMSADAYGRGATEQLPGAAGVYEFPARLRILDGQVLGLDQQRGGHAIVVAADERFDAVDVWQPPLGVDESRAGFERRSGQRLAVTGTSEPDVDEDGHGDKTQDENDLAIAASPGRRSVRVTVRNRGDRTVHLPHVLVRMRGARLLNRSHDPALRAERGYRRVKLPRIGAHGTRTLFVRASRRGFRAKLIAGSEGFDPTRASVVVRGR